MQLDTGQWIVIIICAILILEYIGGYSYNRRKAQQIHAWLQAGLAGWGNIVPGERLPGAISGGRFNIPDPVQPFRGIEVLFLLSPRENLLFWLFHRLQGRQDELVLKMRLKSGPDGDIEVGRQRDREFQRLVADTQGKPFTQAPAPAGLQMASRVRKDSTVCEKVSAFLERYGQSILRLSLKRDPSSLYVRAYLPRLLPENGKEFFQALQMLVK